MSGIATLISNPALDKLVARKQLSMLASLMCERDSEYASMADEVALASATRRARVKATLESLQESGEAPKAPKRKASKGNGRRKATDTVNVVSPS